MSLLYKFIFAAQVLTPSHGGPFTSFIFAPKRPFNPWEQIFMGWPEGEREFDPGGGAIVKACAANETSYYNFTETNPVCLLVYASKV